MYLDDQERTYENVARFSKADADTLEEWDTWMLRAADVLRPLMFQVPPELGSTSPRELLAQAKLAWKLRGLGSRGVADLTRLFTMSISDLLNDWFGSEEVKGLLSVSGVVGTWAGPDEPGTAYVMLHHWIGETDGNVGAWGVPEGGMGVVADACRRSAESSAAEIRTSSRVGRILTRSGRVQGVALDNGDEVRAPIVVTTLHPKISFLELIDREELPSEFVRDIGRWKTRSGVVKINLALSELPDFKADPGTSVQDHHTGDMELSPTLSYAERAFQDAKYGRASERPWADSIIPTALDRTLAPDGVHIMSLFTQYVPASWADAPHREELEAYADRVVDCYDELAPNFKRSVIARQILGPHDLQQELGLVGGNIFHGELTPDQLFHMRPAPGFADYRTPVGGLYQAGSSTHGGGGVCGIPAYNCVRQILRDAKRPRLLH
jgi:phytoene dehydrogenase-like protein